MELRNLSSEREPAAASCAGVLNINYSSSGKYLNFQTRMQSGPTGNLQLMGTRINRKQGMSFFLLTGNQISFCVRNENYTLPGWVLHESRFDLYKEYPAYCTLPPARIKIPITLKRVKKCRHRQV